MAGFVGAVGWIAFAAGIVFAVLPLVGVEFLGRGTAVSNAVLLLVAGPLLVGLGQLIALAARIAENTSWFSSGAPAPVQQPVEAASAAVAKAAEPEPEPEPEPEEELEEEPEAKSPPAPPPVPSAPAAEPELYDPNRHPPAIDEWSHQGRRVMTLEDGTFATEVAGAWYRFMQLQDIEALSD
jgi:hypothetical protein